ncbi:c6 zinc finger domain-containing protein [Ophiostoma piceae UAMH 11346]|uniref:C6 zinc finger domain-containing protein n=1 Tax=Ophiostoma piceae (strain UAMH 11346) TaxID=1262450 RepID=S3CF71_OPHP1|nr:c6 zinc finger domain-containing protein [Ophiostoma piceae UAMH 11346]
MQSHEDDDDEPMDTTSSPSLLQPPSGRKGSKKVRSGCITCKIRKVKCDEAKPYCTRCTRTGRKCDGYLDAAALAIRRRRRRRSTHPDTSQDESTQSTPQLDTDQQYLAGLSAAGQRRGKTASSKTSLSSSPSVSAWATSAQEKHAFDFFQNTTAPCLAGDLDAVFWRVLVLQVCHSEPAVRHAVLAISSLHEVFLRPSPSKTASVPPSDASRVHEFALQQYNKAIAHLLDDMKRDKTSSEEDGGDDDGDDDNDDDSNDNAEDYGSRFQDASQDIAGPGLQRPVAPLMTCILFLCIEVMQGKDKEALLHLEQGRHILSQLGGGRAAADNGQRKSTRPKRSRLAGNSAEMAVVRQHLVPLYTRLSLTSFLFGGYPVPIPRSLKSAHSTSTMPDTFASIHDLRTSVHDFLDAVLRFTGRARPSKYPRRTASPSPTPSATSFSPSPSPASAASANYATLCPGSATSTLAWSSSTSTFMNTLEFEQKTLAAQLRRLRIALSLFRINKPPMFSAPSDATPVQINSNAITLALLQIHLCVAEIWLATATTRAEAAFDAYVETFSTVVSLAATILDAERQQQQQQQQQQQSQHHNHKQDAASTTPLPSTNVFTLETHIIPALYFVATKCRHGPVRRAALSMLSANAGRRENLWRADVLSAVAAHIVEIEEEPDRESCVKEEDGGNGDGYGNSTKRYHHHENSQYGFGLSHEPHEPTLGSGLHSVSNPWFATSQFINNDVPGIHSPDVQDWPGTVPAGSTESEIGLFSVLSTASTKNERGGSGAETSGGHRAWNSSGSIDSSFLADDLFYSRQVNLPAVHGSARSEAATLPALFLSPPTPTASGTAASAVAATKLWPHARSASGSSESDLQSASSASSPAMSPFNTKSEPPSPSPTFIRRELSESMPPSTDAPFDVPEHARVHVAMIGLEEATGRWLTFFRKPNGLDGAWDVRSEFVKTSPVDGKGRGSLSML